MNTTDTSEKGLETLIMRHMTGTDGIPVTAGSVGEKPNVNGTGYFAGSPKNYDRAQAVDVPQLFAFLRVTQPEPFNKLTMADDPKDINRLKFLARLSAEIGKRGIIDVLRKGLDHGPAHFNLFYGAPSPGNAKAEALHAQNRFSITRQLAYSIDETRRALDLCLFINGLPVATFELKNSITKQTVQDAVEQYRRDRDQRERLFGFGRCVVHFAVDDSEVSMCTELKGKASWFLPFNKGYKDGAGTVLGDIDIYLDTNDLDLRQAANSRNAQRVTEFIEQGLSHSTHIMCLVSPSTVRSWWVPNELGFGKKSGKPLATLTLKDTELPEYLEISEIIRGTKSLNQYLTGVKQGLRKSITAGELTESLIKNRASPHPLDRYLDWQA